MSPVVKYPLEERGSKAFQIITLNHHIVVGSQATLPNCLFDLVWKSNTASQVVFHKVQSAKFFREVNTQVVTQSKDKRRCCERITSAELLVIGRKFKKKSCETRKSANYKSGLRVRWAFCGHQNPESSPHVVVSKNGYSFAFKLCF